MSKNKAKDKKVNEPSVNLEEVVEQQKRQLLQQNFTIKRLQDRISRMTEENYQITTNSDSRQKKYEEKIDNQRIFIQSHESTIQSLNDKVRSLQIMKLEQEAAIKTLENHLDFQVKNRQKQMEEYKRLVQTEMGVLENQLKQYNHYMQERDDVFQERSSLKKELEGEKQQKMRELADKEREKVQVTDKLKDQMLTQIRDMKNKLLSLKKDQLQTTTRLAVLQNHQLTGELQFQSKQTQKLLFQNQKLQKKVSNLQKDIQIHKQVEEELAKRSHISKGIIKKLTNKISQLEEQLNKKTDSEAESTKRFTVERNQDVEKQQQIINSLDRALEDKQKRYLKLRTDFITLENQNTLLKTKIKDFEKKSNELSLMLVRYYGEILNGNIDLKPDDSDYILDIKSFKKKPVQEWNTEDTKFIVNILLNQLKGSVNRYNLGVPTINKSHIIVNDDEQQTKFPTIGLSDHSLIKKQSRKLKEIPSSLAPKLVGSSIRQWGRTVHSNSVSNLISKKYKP